MDAGAPERLVRIDVPQPGQRPLVEERRLDRSAPAREPCGEGLRREAALERLLAEAGVEIRLHLAGLEQEPGAEPAHVAVRDVRAVVEADQRTAVHVFGELALPHGPRHAQVNQQRAAAREPHDEVLPPALDALDALADELRRDLVRVLRPREAHVLDLHVLEPPALEERRDLGADGLDLRQFRHPAVQASRSSAIGEHLEQHGASRAAARRRAGAPPGTRAPPPQPTPRRGRGSARPARRR